jgi:hypothetical protein
LDMLQEKRRDTNPSTTTCTVLFVRLGIGEGTISGVAVSACHLVPHRIHCVPVCHGPRSDDLGDVRRRFILLVDSHWRCRIITAKDACFHLKHTLDCSVPWNMVRSWLLLVCCRFDLTYINEHGLFPLQDRWIWHGSQEQGQGKNRLYS